MVLVDTSVWIRALANRSPYVSELRRLLDRDDVIGHSLIYGELLIGDRGGRLAFLAAYSKMRHATVLPHDEVVAFALARKLHGLGIGWIDTHILASAIVGRFQLWTADQALADIAKEFKISYKGVYLI